MAPASSADPNPPSDIHEIERATKNTRIVPRLIRFRDAPYYLGMDRNRFNSEVRPYLTEIPIGSQGIGFDRLELDAWLDEYIARNGRPAPKGDKKWDANKPLASSSVRAFGISTSKSTGGEFAKALERLVFPKRKSILRG